MTRTYAEARAFAWPIAMSGDRVGATNLLSNLLWHVDGADGGFIGLSDEQILDKCESDGCLSYSAATAAMYAPTPWPSVG